MAVNKDTGKSDIYVEPVGKAKMYLVTKPLPGAVTQGDQAEAVGELPG